MNTIQQLYNEWQSLQPLKPEDQKRLDQKFMLEFNYNSNHIEGNTLTYGQTKLLFMFGETTGNASLRDYEEMKAHNVGLEMMKREATDKERPLSEMFIRELNRTILVENFWKNAKTPTGETTRMEVQVGVYKTRQNSVITATGEIFEYASPQETPAFMTDLVSWYNEEERKGELSPIELAALLHYRYIRIHPFEDGNGRIARLLVNYVLYHHGYPMIIVRSDKEHKDEYLRILHQCDVEVGLSPSDGAHASMEQIQPFVAYMESQLQRALEISIKAAKGESIEEEGDLDKKISLLQRNLTSKYNEDQSDQIEGIIRDCLTPFLLKWDAIMSKFDKLFKVKTNYITTVLFTDDSFDFESIITLLDAPIYQTAWKELFIDTTYSDLINPSLAIECTVPDIHIKFSSDKYVITINSDEKYTFKKKLTEVLTEQEIDDIVRYGSQIFLKTIEEEVKNI